MTTKLDKPFKGPQIKWDTKETLRMVKALGRAETINRICDSFSEGFITRIVDACIQAEKTKKKVKSSALLGGREIKP